MGGPCYRVIHSSHVAVLYMEPIEAACDNVIIKILFYLYTV